MDTILKDLPELYISTTTPEPITMSEEDPKWNILLPGLVGKGPYSLKNLRCLHDISSSSSQHIKVWKEGENKDTAMTLPNALKLFSQKKWSLRVAKGDAVVDADAQSMSLIIHFWSYGICNKKILMLFAQDWKLIWWHYIKKNISMIF